MTASPFASHILGSYGERLVRSVKQALDRIVICINVPVKDERIDPVTPNPPPFQSTVLSAVDCDALRQAGRLVIIK